MTVPESSHWTPLQRLALIVVLLVGGALRLGALDRMEFRYDSAYWAMEGLEILGGARPLLGQQVGSVSVPLYNGPLMSYVVAGVFSVAGPRPEAVAALVALANVAGIWLTALIARKLCRNGWCALIAPAMMAVAPWFVLHGRMLWPQSMFPALMPLIWLALVALIERPSWGRGLILGFALGIGLQLHLSMLAVAGLAGVLAVLCGRRPLACAASVGVGIAVGYSPLVVHDLTHGFETVRTLAALPALHGAAEPPMVHFAKALWNFSNVLSGQAMWVSKLGPPNPLPPVVDWGQGLTFTVAFASACLMAARSLLRRDNRPWLDRVRRPEALLLLLVWIPVLYLAVSQAQITRHYFLVLFPLPFLLIAWAADQADLAGWRRASIVTVLAVGLVLNGAALVYLSKWLVDTGGAAAYGPTLRDRAQAVAAIRTDSNDRFTVDVRATREALPYVFLFERDTGATVDADPQLVTTISARGQGAVPGPLRYRIVEPEFAPPGITVGTAGTVLWRSPSIAVERTNER